MDKRFSNKDILRKIQKLQVLVERGETDGEKKQAQDLLDKILRKYELDESVLEERDLVQIPHLWEMRRIVKHLAWALELEVYTGGKWKDKIYINVTPSEKEIFDEIWCQIKQLYMRRKKILEQELQSYMQGFLDKSYPIKSKPTCPKCGLELAFHNGEMRYICSCGYKGKKVKIRHLDASSYMRGADASGKYLSDRTQ